MDCDLKGCNFLFILVCSADLDIRCITSFSHHTKVNSFMFMYKISTQMVCIKGKQPRIHARYYSMHPFNMHTAEWQSILSFQFTSFYKNN